MVNITKPRTILPILFDTDFSTILIKLDRKARVTLFQLEKTGIDKGRRSDRILYKITKDEY